MVCFKSPMGAPGTRNLSRSFSRLKLPLRSQQHYREAGSCCRTGWKARLHPAGGINVFSKSHRDPSGSSEDISLRPFSQGVTKVSRAHPLGTTNGCLSNTDTLYCILSYTVNVPFFPVVLWTFKRRYQAQYATRRRVELLRRNTNTIKEIHRAMAWWT